ILRMIDDVGVADIGVRTHCRDANAQIDDPTVLELARDEVGHLLAIEAFAAAHRRRSCRLVGQSPSGAGGTCTNRCTNNPEQCTASASISPAGTIGSSTSTMVQRAAVAITGLKLRCARWNCRLPNVSARRARMNA